MNNTKSYAWDAKDYAKNSQNQLQWAKELIPKLKLQENEVLLDLGAEMERSQLNLQSACQKAEQSA